MTAELTSELRKAIALRGEARFEESKTILDALLKQNPDNAEVNYHTAWWHDVQGLEQEAVPFYEKALSGRLDDVDRQGALLGLGSTLRCVGEFERSAKFFEQAIEEYPQNKSFEIFLALALFELGRTNQAFAIVLKQLALTTDDEHIARYKRALLECADNYASKKF